jgi:tetratricopeptide (TPR) repeat protein
MSSGHVVSLGVVGAALLLSAAALAPLQTPQSASTRENAYRANNIGVARLEQYNYPEAAASFQRALELEGGLRIARVNLAIAQLYAGKADEALRAARAVGEQAPDLPQAHYVAGLAARALGQSDEAVLAFQRVLKIDAADAGSRINLGQVHLQQREYAEAVLQFREALAAEPFNATAAYGLATALTRSGAGDEGRQAMQRFETLREHPAAITYSQTYLEQGKYGEAIASTGAEPELVDPTPPAVTFVDATAGVLPATSPTKPLPPGQVTPPPGGSVILFDADGDGDLDAFTTSPGSPAGQRFYLNDAGRFADATARAGLASAAGRTAMAAVAADSDNDGRTDLLVLTGGGARLYRQSQGGRFEDVTENAGLLGAIGRAVSAAFVDVDHDGDLDVFIAGTDSPTQGGTQLPAQNQLLRNDGKGSFTDVTAASGLADGAGQRLALAPTDFDNGRDIDLLVLGASSGPRLFKNLRDGTFRDVARDVGLPASDGYTALAAADVNKDGYPDFVFARAQAPAVLARSDGRGRFVIGGGPDGLTGATVVQFVDYDNDGLLDLFVAGGRAARLFRNLGSTWSDVSRRAGLSELTAALVADITAVAFGDVDGDGDPDALVALADGAVRYWRNEGGTTNRAFRVRLEGRVSNRLGVGAKVEVRAGSLRQKIEVSAVTPAIAPADVLFGLGRRAEADVVRVIWPSGTLQAETPADLKPLTIAELDRKPSSCPYLYTWNGSRFEFLTDFMGGGEIGYWQGPGQWNTPDPDEYVRIPPGRLVPRAGRYELRVTNELEEALFVDHLQLVAVDHLEDVNVYPFEGLGAPARAGFDLATARRPRPPVAALDEHGHDVVARLTTIDRQYPDDFPLIDIRGYADRHDLRLDLGEGASQAVLLATAWTDYAFSSDNVAAHQRGLSLEPPSLDVRSADGTWRRLLANVGIPVGRPQTVVVDLRGKLRPGEREVRIRTNMRIYWDQILVDTSGSGAPVRITRIDPSVADLRWRGFSAEITPDGRQPYGYDYERVSLLSPWKTMVGRYTRVGDVRELLRSIDDMFVVSRPGDEIALSFDEGALPILATGQRRAFLLYAHGYSKEMDIGSASPHHVEPLPFRGMRGYPYAEDQRYPASEAHREYRDRYNTRVVSRPLPPIESSRQR